MLSSWDLVFGVTELEFQFLSYVLEFWCLGYWVRCFGLGIWSLELGVWNF